jgi:hypothetical protein
MMTRVVLAGIMMILVVGTSGCSRVSYFDLKKERDAVRYQYQLEHLYVAGLAVQNRQLTERRQNLLDEIERVSMQRSR